MTSLKHEELIQDDNELLLLCPILVFEYVRNLFSVCNLNKKNSDSRAEQCSLDNGVHLCYDDTHYHRRSHLLQHLPKPKCCTFYDEDGDGAFDYRGGDYGEKTMRTNELVLIFFLQCIRRLQILRMIDTKKNQHKTRKHLQTPSWEESGTAERIHRLCCANTHVVCEEGRTQVCHWFILFLFGLSMFLCVFCCL